MKPSSRTPEGEPNRCPLCGKRLRLEPSEPSRDAPCPFCGCLLWFDPSTPGTPDQDLDLEEPIFIRLFFHGGCSDGVWLAGDPKFLADRYGRRYSRLAMRAEVGTRWREVPHHEHAKIRQVLSSYDPVAMLSQEELDEIALRLQHVTAHVYEVTQMEKTEDEIELHLTFVCTSSGLK